MGTPLNVIRSHMSLVGPRPHTVAMRAGDRFYGEAVERYLHRHSVKPGIVRWAQVSELRGEVDTLERRTPGSRTIFTTSSTGPLGSI
jgi:lipopolysaccharide/colanic/teichoic acid biosynthesis glycosyltransferase